MRFVRLFAAVFGALLAFSGLFWALQGAGVIMWPAESFMLADRQWVWNGLGTAAVGILLVWWGRQR
jgi:hypothetical protein